MVKFMAASQARGDRWEGFGGSELGGISNGTRVTKVFQKQEQAGDSQVQEERRRRGFLVGACFSR